VIFTRFLRGQQVFDSLEEFLGQMAQDVEQARFVLDPPIP
jgi:FAD synthase